MGIICMGKSMGYKSMGYKSMGYKVWDIKYGI
jgi:hypothetical protein